MQSVDRLPFDLKNRVRHSGAVLKSIERIDNELGEYATGTMLGGLLRNGQMSYVAVGPMLEVMTSRTGARISSCNFDSIFNCTTHVTCVTELSLATSNACVLAVGLDSARHGGLVCLLAVHGAQLLRTIELADKITAIAFVGDRLQCERLGALRTFDGCLAVGTGTGSVVLLDLRLRQFVDMLLGRTTATSAVAAAIHRTPDGSNSPISNHTTDNRDCLIVCASVTFEEQRREQRNAAAEQINFGVQLPGLDGAGAVLAMLVLRPLQAFAVGLSDGRMVLYTLRSGEQFEAFHLAHPAAEESPLLRLAMCEPADDPRACMYLWAFHVHAETTIAAMHCLMYDRKRQVQGPSDSVGCGDEDDEYEDDADEDFDATAVYTVYEGFQSCSVRLTLPLFDCEAYPIACQSVRRTLRRGGSGGSEDDDEADTLSLCMLAWTSGKTNGSVGAEVHGAIESTTMVCVFDLNQWYKEQMPRSCDWRRGGNTFLAVFPVDIGSSAVLDVWMDAGSVMPFASLQRPEEHFRPEALNLECIAFNAVECCRLRWSGLQNKSLELLAQNGPIALVQPTPIFNTMVRATLIPQFTECNALMSPTISYMQHFLLSVALEYNCASLLRDCALSWADGSHLGADPRRNGGGLSLSTLTDWLWQRAGDTKTCCNALCVQLFDYSSCTLDMRSRQQFLNSTRQLRTLAELMGTVLTRCRRYIPDEILGRLQSQRDAIRMAFEYQEVLQWLLNIGLLPEGAEIGENASGRVQTAAVPYPYRALRSFYQKQRHKYRTFDAALLNAKQSCRVLYIDAFIEHECNPACLRAEWRQIAGAESDAATGLYPPSSLQAMLRTLLVPGVAAEIKYTLFVYLFLDLSVALADERYASVVQRLIKFPAVFGLNPALIKTTQAFWSLDHGQLETAIEELISPLSQERHLQRWQQETLIESLLVQQAPHLALRALRAPRPPITALLEIRTLLANNLVSEAFQLQRAKADSQLLGELFRTCHVQQKWQLVLDLALTGAEESSLGEFLRTCDSALTENLHFVYLLQRGKYIEAIMFVDDLQHNRRTNETAATHAASASGGGVRRKAPAADLETPATILAAYKQTLTPATRAMANMYHSMRDHINAKLNDQAPTTQTNRQASKQQTTTTTQPKICHPNPLSSKLLQHKLNMLGGVYQRSLLSAEHTSPSYWFNRPQRMCSLNADAVPFLRNPQCDIAALAQRQLLVHAAHGGQLSHAVEYVGSQKRNARAQEQHDGQLGSGDDAYAPQKRRRVDDAPISQSNAATASTAANSSGVVVGCTLTTAAATAAAAAAANAAAASAKAGKILRMVAVLGTPVVEASNVSARLSRMVATPQSILKARTTAAATLDEKSIRFDLPGDGDTSEVAPANNVTDTNDSEDDNNYVSFVEVDENADNVMDATDVGESDETTEQPECPETIDVLINDSVTVSPNMNASSITADTLLCPSDTLTIEVPAPENSQTSYEQSEADETSANRDADVELTSPPANQSKKLVHSQQPSPLQRRINLGEGPMPRKRLRSQALSQTADVSATAESPQPTDTKPDVILSVPVTRKSKTLTPKKNAPAQHEFESTSIRPIRRSSRSRSIPPEISESVSTANASNAGAEPVATSTSTSSPTTRATPQLSRKPLSRLVLEANAQKAITTGVGETEKDDVTPISGDGGSGDAVNCTISTALNESSVCETSSDLSNTSAAYLTDDSQRFLEYWQAKKGFVPVAVGRRMSVGSQSESEFDERHTTFNDSDASFVCNDTTRPADTTSGSVDQEHENEVLLEAEPTSQIHNEENVNEGSDSDNIDDDEEMQIDDEFTIDSSSSSSDSEQHDDIADAEDIINISSSSDKDNSSSSSDDSNTNDINPSDGNSDAVSGNSNDKTESNINSRYAVAIDTHQTRNPSTSSSTSTDDGNSNENFHLVSAVVHSEPTAIDIDEKSSSTTASSSSDSRGSGNNKYHSANSTTALLYGDLEEIRAADDDADDVLNEAVAEITVEQSNVTEMAISTTTDDDKDNEQWQSNGAADNGDDADDVLNEAVAENIAEQSTETEMAITTTTDDDKDNEQWQSNGAADNGDDADYVLNEAEAQIIAEQSIETEITITATKDDQEIEQRQSNGDLNNALFLESSASVEQEEMAVEDNSLGSTLNRGIIGETDASMVKADSMSDKLPNKEDQMETNESSLEERLTEQLEAAVEAMDEDVIVNELPLCHVTNIAQQTPATTDDDGAINEKTSDDAGIVKIPTIDEKNVVNFAEVFDLQTAKAKNDNVENAANILEQPSTSSEQADIEKTSIITLSGKGDANEDDKFVQNASDRNETRPPNQKSSDTISAIMPVTPTTNTRRSLRLRSNSQLETPTTPTTRTPLSARKQRGQSEPKQLIAGGDVLRRAASVRRMLEESNAIAVAEKVTPSTPTRRARRNSKQGTPTVEDIGSVETPTRRLTRRSSRNISPSLVEPNVNENVVTPTGTLKRSMRGLRATSVTSNSPLDVDDNASVVSHSSAVSRQSTRTTRSTLRSKGQKPLEQQEQSPNSQNAETHDENDFDDSASQKSAKSTHTTLSLRTRAAAKTLPAIVEVEKSPDDEDDDQTNDHAEVTASTSEYSDSRRLTRHQISIMERMKTAQQEASIRNADQAKRTRRGASVSSSPDDGKSSGRIDNEDGDEPVENDHHDEEDDNRSVQSGTSRRSARSLRSRRGTKTTESTTKTLDAIVEQTAVVEDDKDTEDAETASEEASKLRVRTTRNVATKK